MDVDRFWELIEESRREAGDCEEQARVLTARLELLPPEEIVSFQTHLDARRRESYRWDIWAVACIINGGCSDDGFDYFRGWLIAQGRDFFEMVLRTPERAGEGVPAGAEHDYDFECESILYAAYGAYEAKTGQEMPLEELPASGLTEPEGEPWDEADLESLYPDLTRRFYAE